MRNSITGLEYRNLDEEIKRTMKRSAGDAVRLGYLLQSMRDKKLWEECYSCFDEYLEKELRMDYTMASRFIGIHKKYSIDGSGNIDGKWEGYSQAVLIEMLNMPPELEAEITPDMTVRQVRKVKRQAKESKRRDSMGMKAESRMEEPAAADASRVPADGAPQELTEGGTGDGRKDQVFSGKAEIPDAEYRELDASRRVATSQVPELVNEALKLQPEEEGIPQDNTAGRGGGGFNEYAEIRHFLAQEKKRLDEYLADGGLPEKTVFKQKVITAALAAMVSDMEHAAHVPEPVKQPELPVFKNNSQRKEWLAAYKDWGLWYRDDNIGAEYYKYDFDNGARLIAEVYMNEASKFCSAYESCFLHLVGGPEGRIDQNRSEEHTSELQSH